MPVSDRGLGQGDNKRQNFSHVVDLLFQVLVGFPRLENTG
jgi:hypothetical protein